MRKRSNSSDYTEFCLLVPEHIEEEAFTWIPGHSESFMNEAVGHLDSTSHSTSEINLLLSFLFGASARFKHFSTQSLLTRNTITGHTDFVNLKYPWPSNTCSSWQCEVTLTHFRSRVPNIKFYLHRCRQIFSTLCAYYQAAGTIHYFLLSRCRFRCQLVDDAPS